MPTEKITATLQKFNVNLKTEYIILRDYEIALSLDKTFVFRQMKNLLGIIAVLKIVLLSKTAQFGERHAFVLKQFYRCCERV